MPRSRRSRDRAPALPPGTRTVLRAALAEDRYREDRTTSALLPRGVPVRARLTAQERGVLSGAAAAAEVARIAGLRVTRVAPDGRAVRPGTPVLEVEGDGRRVLGAERTMLNLLMHLSGVATATAEAVRAAGPSFPVRTTRKLTPGLRDLERAAVAHGGGALHRRDLASGVLVKSNHLVLVPVREAVARLRGRWGHRYRIEVEVHDLRGARAALAAGADELLLDNLTPARARRLVRAIRALPNGAEVPLELSGGITPRNLARYARTGASSASLGGLTHSARAVRFHLTVLGARAPAHR